MGKGILENGDVLWLFAGSLMDVEGSSGIAIDTGLDSSSDMAVEAGRESSSGITAVGCT